MAFSVTEHWIYLGTFYSLVSIFFLIRGGVFCLFPRQRYRKSCWFVTKSKIKTKHFRLLKEINFSSKRRVRDSFRYKHFHTPRKFSKKFSHEFNFSCKWGGSLWWRRKKVQRESEHRLIFREFRKCVTSLVLKRQETVFNSSRIVGKTWFNTAVI